MDFLSVFTGAIGAAVALISVYKIGVANGKKAMKADMQKLLAEKDDEITKLKTKPTGFKPLPKQKNLRVC